MSSAGGAAPSSPPTRWPATPARSSARSSPDGWPTRTATARRSGWPPRSSRCPSQPSSWHPRRVASYRKRMCRRHHRTVSLDLVLGDIIEQHVDAIVNAANSSLLGGGGVDGAIHRRGGPAILAACRELRAGHYGGGLPTGQAVATTAGELPARWVIHTVGPVYAASDDRSELLRSCYRESLRVAGDLGASS